ncbi:MAG: cytochrome c biogenesis protein CcdA [Candidatus Omnitrophica bacterium]|nr:cytochrome c biogenesis protein CcdA [Candidatus Omnitrophota bacterium]
MIGHVFEVLTNALQATPLIALGASFVWGILSIVLSPCHLASIPLIVGFINGQGTISTRRAFSLSFLFSFGILITIAVIGLITSYMGRMLGDVGAWGNYFVSGIFFIVGFHLLGILKLPFIGVSQPGIKKKGMWAAFFLGLLFGIALGPCTFAYMAPMLAITFSLSSTRLVYGSLLLCAYGIGHCSVIVLAGTCTEMVERYLEWNESSHGTVILKKICGILVILGGIYLITLSRG